MDLIITICHELLEHGGAGTFMMALLSLLLFHVGLLLVAYRFNLSSWPAVLQIFFMKKSRNRRLSDSTFFQSMTFLKTGVIPRLNLTCLLRNKIFTRLLYIKVDAMESAIKNFISKEDSWKDFELEDLALVLKSVLAEMDITWQRECRERGIPGVAIDLFKKYDNNKMDILDEVLLSASLSKYTSHTNHERVLLFLDGLSTRKIKSFDSLDGVINELNGHLSRVEFEGAKCTHCDPTCPHQDKVE
jgi:hypothetical protein